MNCLDCGNLMQDYFDKSSCFTEYICYKCGNYASNSPAYLSNPDGFKNTIRENPLILRRLLTDQPKFDSQKNNRGLDSTL